MIWRRNRSKSSTVLFGLINTHGHPSKTGDPFFRPARFATTDSSPILCLVWGRNGQRPPSPLPPFTLGEERKSQATGPVQWFIWYLNKRAHAALVPSPSFFTGPLRLFMGKEALVNYRDGRIWNGYNSLSWYRRHVRFIHLVYLLLFLFPSSICFDVNGFLVFFFYIIHILCDLR